jgi:hypothetical protein
MGIAFSGHPNLKRMFLWEGFPGHPLRKDFLALPEGHSPGLQRFPFEFPAGQRGYPNLAAPGGPAAPAVPRLRPPLPGQSAAEETSGGQLGTGGGGSNEVRSPTVRILNRGPLNPPPGGTEAGGRAPATGQSAEPGSSEEEGQA